MNKTKILVGIVLSVLIAFVAFSESSQVLGNVTDSIPTPKDTFQEYTFFATSTAQTIFATTTTATSTNINSWLDTNGRKDNGYFVIAGAKAVNMYFSRGGLTNPNVGSTKYEVEVSEDGTNWYAFNQMYLSDISRTASSTIWITAATSTVVTSLDLSDKAFYALRVIVKEITDGEHSVKATASF